MAGLIFVFMGACGVAYFVLVYIRFMSDALIDALGKDSLNYTYTIFKDKNGKRYLLSKKDSGISDFSRYEDELNFSRKDNIFAFKRNKKGVDVIDALKEMEYRFSDAIQENKIDKDIARQMGLKVSKYRKLKQIVERLSKKYPIKYEEDLTQEEKENLYYALEYVRIHTLGSIIITLIFVMPVFMLGLVGLDMAILSFFE